MKFANSNKTYIALKLIIQTVIFIGFAVALYEQNWLNATVTAGIIVLSTIPTLFARSFSLTLPPIFELATIAFLFASMFLGELGDFYERFWWWDLALHTTSGLLLGILGFLMIWILNANERINLEMSTLFMCIFAFAFAVAAGTLWEIFEFAADTLFKTNMQKSGLVDTMTDLIVDSIGALIISVGAYFYLDKDKRPRTVQNFKRYFKAYKKKPK